MLKFARAVGWAVSGIRYAVITQRNMKIHLVVAIPVIVTCLYLKMSPAELAIISLTIFLVLAAEMFNTAIEVVVDLFTADRHPLARAAKDVGAGAVLLTAINALIVAYLLIWPRIAGLFG
ncbi:diacylglycerol kinase [Desulfotruncus alcoholivorax]|uniref:diacylglycerol kinase n=1 Tax=Desulfotruncus alcoholivorax TaxID=265477 RepID=UPI0003FD60B8|nr:diacylglycerol kinase family protein [Desulfotruncus alcoholivorax]